MQKADVRLRLERDRERLHAHHARFGLPRPRHLWLNPSYQCVVLHRWSAYHFQRGNRLLSRLLWNVNLLLTGADLGAISEIGPGVVILHPVSTQVFGRLGEDCTLWGHGGIGGGRSAEDIGAGPGLPIVGDRVSFGARAMALGPVTIGDDVSLGPGAIITRDIPAGSQVEIVQQRTLRPAADR